MYVVGTCEKSTSPMMTGGPAFIKVYKQYKRIFIRLRAHILCHAHTIIQHFVPGVPAAVAPTSKANPTHIHIPYINFYVTSVLYHSSILTKGAKQAL